MLANLEKPNQVTRAPTVDKGGGFGVERRSDGVLMAVLDTKKRFVANGSG